ncbi:Cysteine-rich protein 1 [Bonamia ostreae]|uniref:Cysteine-rich protein 1 n=1 Tax=Bonamia ostreae TaxID=126728 RepID=A0ABV2APG7_9EUKA
MENPKCRKCEKAVFFAEKVSYGGINWHKACFRCEICSKTLTKGKQQELNEKIVCASCYEKNKPVLRKVYRPRKTNEEEKEQIIIEKCTLCEQNLEPSMNFCSNCGNKSNK